MPAYHHPFQPDMTRIKSGPTGTIRDANGNHLAERYKRLITSPGCRTTIALMRPLVLLLAVLQILSAVAIAKQEPVDEPAETPTATVSLQLVSRFQNQVEVTEQAGALSITTTGNDPYIQFDLRASLPSAIADAPQELGKLNVLAFEYFSAAGIHGIEVRLRDRGDWQPVIDAGSLLAAQGWSQGQLRLVDSDNNFWSEGQPRILRIDFGQEAGRSISLRAIKLREPTQAERDLEQRAAAEWAEKLSLAAKWDEYLSPQMPQAIERVAVEEQIIALEVKASSAGQGVMLAELEPHQSSAIAGPRRIVASLERGTEVDNSEPLRFQFPRRLDGYDRLHSRWQLVTATADAGIYAPATTATYATQLNVSDRELPPPPALRNAKGLGGVSPVFGLEELVELGIQHITVNLVITDLIEPVIETSSGTPAEPATASSDETFEYAGRRWKLRTGRLHHVDQTVAFASQHGIVVAAIVLLPQRSSDSIVHPDSTSSGIYAMPNLTDRDAALKYAAVMHVLAQRYSGQELGRIDHWIMHNEVDFGWVWTNMGQQPLALFMDHYVRSMRIAALETRQANPHALVFISLTHHWNVPDDPRGRTYSPRRQLDWLAASSAAEGDFPWGIAHHPYPENLFNPRTWEDKQAVDDMQTKYITMKNLQVLKRFLQQPPLLNSDGTLRSVLLSEQGYHTPDYSRESQELQSQALEYTWQRLRETDFVLAYDYHRWVDAAEEGGLLLGLRTVGDAKNIAGKKKLGWTTYRDLK